MSLVENFKELMSSKFKMSMIGELSFFLGLQITQKRGYSSPSTEVLEWDFEEVQDGLMQAYEHSNLPSYSSKSRFLRKQG